MTALVFCDLDGTVVHSMRELAGLDPNDLLPLELVGGRPGAFVSPQAWEHLTGVMRFSRFVPTTTRTREQFARLHLPVTPPAVIAGNGLWVQFGGVPDDAWTRRCRRLLAGSAAPATVLRAVAGMTTARGHRVVVRDAAFCSVLGPAPAGSGLCEELRERVEGFGWVVWPGARSVQLTPVGLTKEAAARHVAARLPGSTTVACGNEAIDDGLVAWADIAAVRARPGGPAGGAGCSVVDEAGPRGAELLLERVLRHVGCVQVSGRPSAR